MAVGPMARKMMFAQVDVGGAVQCVWGMCGAAVMARPRAPTPVA